jgi:hypothetical protein
MQLRLMIFWKTLGSFSSIWYGQSFFEMIQFEMMVIQGELFLSKVVKAVLFP